MQLLCFLALQLLRLSNALIVYASSAQLRTGVIGDVKTDVTQEKKNLIRGHRRCIPNAEVSTTLLPL